MIIYKTRYFLNDVHNMIVAAAHACNPSAETTIIKVHPGSIDIESLPMKAMNDQWIAKIKESLGEGRMVSLVDHLIHISY